MTYELKIIFRFEKTDLKAFNKWKKANNYSLRKISKETGISHTYIDDMIKGRRVVSQKFYDWLCDKCLIGTYGTKFWIGE